jgi:hypothetical protein
MILNSYAVLSVFVALLRLLLALGVIGIAVSACRRPWMSCDALEDRSYLVFLLALALLVLNLVSWPLLYLLLQSYVPYWAGVMCIYGVTRVGEGSLGPARFLPELLRLLQLSKPALVFAGGAWFILYLLNRRTTNAALLGRLFVVLLPLGALAAADAILELTYVGIPKKEEFPSVGCCTALDEPSARLSSPTGLEAAKGLWRQRLYLEYYGFNVALILALVVSARRLGGAFSGVVLVGLLLLAAAALAASSVFLEEVAAPTLLGLPHHHCAYDLIPDAPEALVAVALYVGGLFCLGWACVASWLGRKPETEPVLPGFLQGLLRLSLCGYLMSLMMLSLELALA